MRFPKVLIIGQMFDKDSGGGITLSNLFTGWDSDSIAVLATKTENPDFSVCKNVYCIGDLEIERGFPFNLKLTGESSKSGVLNTETELKKKQVLRAKPKPGKLERIKDRLIILTGQIHRRRRFLISNELSKWINDFDPDIIYTQLSSFEIIQFIRVILKNYHKPLAIHIMDDWPKTITGNQVEPFKSYWHNRINNGFRQLIEQASVLMSISESMSEEYLKRYGKKFYPFHNPVDTNRWVTPIQKNYSINVKFKILYAGRIGSGLQRCLIDTAKAIQKLANKGFKVEFIIQPTNINPVLDELVKYEFVSIRPLVPYKSLPEIFSSADVLLLPNDFDRKSVSFLRYSMPTKASEYMVSGTPIVVFSHPENALTKHATKYNWAFVVAENSNERLESAFKALYENEDLRKSIGSRAKEFAIQYFDSTIIRKRFKDALQNKL